jgi:hypothetical protein
VSVLCATPRRAIVAGVQVAKQYIMAETFRREAAVAEREALRGPAPFKPNLGKLATVTTKIGSHHEVLDPSKLPPEDLEQLRKALEDVGRPPKAKWDEPARESDEYGWFAEEFAPAGTVVGGDMTASAKTVDEAAMADRRLPKRTCPETVWAQEFYTRHGFINPFSNKLGK